jgi:hypothetical protein
MTQSRAIVFTLVLALSIATLATIGTAAARPLDPIAPSETARQLSELTHIPFDGKALEKPDGWSGSCRKSIVTIEVMDTVTGLTRSQNLTLIRPAKNLAPTPVMIVVPTMEGITPVETSTASGFCDAGMATIIADVDDNSIPQAMPSWGLEDVRNRYSILALRTTIDFAKSSPYFDPNKVGFMGLSLGAIMGSFVAGLEGERLAAIVLVLAGGDIPFILSVSDNDRVRQMRDGRMQATGMTDSVQYEEVLHQTVRYDPLHFASRAKPQKMLMVMSSNDTKVPTAMQNDLYEAFGKPENSVYKSGHVQTIIALTYWYFDTVTDFLNKKFGIKTKTPKTRLMIERSGEAPPAPVSHPYLGPLSR